MISKRILLVILGIAVLLCIVVVLVVYGFSLRSQGSTKTHVFEWTTIYTVETDDIGLPIMPLNVFQIPLNNTLQMEITFTVEGENLLVIAKINDTEYNEYANLGLVFDMNDDGNITTGEAGFQLYANNETWMSLAYKTHCLAPLDPYGFLDIGVITPTGPSPFHTCVFDDEGYTFNVSLPLSELNTSNDLVHVCYKTRLKWVYARFHIGISLVES